MIHPNFHVFVIVSTLLFVIILRNYKNKNNVSNNQHKKKSSSNLIYILFIPLILYLSHYLFASAGNTTIAHSKLPSSTHSNIIYPPSVSTD